MANKRIILIFSSILCLHCQINAVLAMEIPVEQLYEDAFKLVLADNYAEAYDKFGKIIHDYPNTTYAQFAEIRRKHLEEIGMPGIRRKGIDQSGRIESVIFGTLYSTWLGVGSAYLADADSGKAAAAGMMIGAPAGLLASLALTRNATLSDGQAALINFSGYWGTWQGYGLSILLDKNDDEKTMIGSAMAGGLLGLAMTSAITKRINPSSGDASMINYGGLWGTWFALLAGSITDHDYSDGLLAFSLVGGNLGVTAMAILAPKTELNFTQASLVNLSGIVGTIVTFGSLLILQPDSERVMSATLMAGGILGLVGGYAAFGNAQESSFKGLSYNTDSKNTYSSNEGEIQLNLISAQF